MQINATKYSVPLGNEMLRAAVKAADARDAALFAESQALAAKLQGSAEIRPEAVERARALIRQTDYPPDMTIRGIAHLLATNLDRVAE